MIPHFFGFQGFAAQNQIKTNISAVRVFYQPTAGLPMFTNQDVKNAHQSFQGVIAQTPCLFSPYFSALLSANVYLKLENMHRTGSFKERGALNFLLKNRELKHVVTASAGNHAQAVALQAGRLGIKATIFMPKGTPNNKILETEKLKAEVRLIGQSYDEAYSAAKEFAESCQAGYLHAYNDADVICGQATVALEMLQQVKNPDIIFCPVGGGGLLSGISQYIANEDLLKKPMVVGVEAVEFQSMAQALDKGKKVLSTGSKTIAEGIAVRNVGGLTQEICMRYQPEFVAVNDQEIQKALMLLVERQKIVAEGAGAASLAALLMPKNRLICEGKTVICIVSGGNIDISLLARLTAHELVKSSRLCRMSLVIKDCPGSLSRLLQEVTKVLGNIVDIRHERSFVDIKWNEVLVDLTVETKDEDHETRMLKALANQGYVIDRHERESGRV